MKKSIFFASMILTSYCLYGQAGSQPYGCISKADAEKIMGQASKLTEGRSGTKNGILEFRCTYMAEGTDSKSGKRGNLYYSVKEYLSAEQAHDTLANFNDANRNSPGWTVLTGIGDEAISHTDKKNFQLVIIRKGNKMLLMKVNKVTAFTTPLETLLAVGKNITRTF